MNTRTTARWIVFGIWLITMIASLFITPAVASPVTTDPVVCHDQPRP